MPSQVIPEAAVEAASVETIKCGWRACEKQISPETPGDATRQYCSKGHKVKSADARRRKAIHSRAEFRDERAWVASGFYFAKMMLAAERIAYAFGHDPDLVRDAMVDSMSKRIDKYNAERDGDA